VCVCVRVWVGGCVVGVGGSNACFATLEQNPERRYSGWSLWMCVGVWVWVWVWVCVCECVCVCVCVRERESCGARFGVT